MRTPHPSSLVKYLKPKRVERFWSLVEDQPNGCRTWTASRTPQGYGRFSISHKGATCIFYAHRLAYALEYGPFDDSKVIRHTCANTSCVNPRHLKIGSMEDNAGDRVPTKFTDEQVKAIFRDTRPRPEIAEAYGCSLPYVSGVKHGRIRPHVTGATPKRRKTLR